MNWINGPPIHGTCPTCRDEFLEIPYDEDTESSDGGEYQPEDDLDDDEMMADDSFATSDDDFDTDHSVEMSDWDESFSSDPTSQGEQSIGEADCHFGTMRSSDC